MANLMRVVPREIALSSLEGMRAFLLDGPTMKRRWLLVPAIALIFVAACCFGAVWIFQNEICDGNIALKDMDNILQGIRRQSLLTDGAPMWKDLERWLNEAPGPYQLVLIDLEIPITPGDDATVGIQLSNGKAIVCSFVTIQPVRRRNPGRKANQTKPEREHPEYVGRFFWQLKCNCGHGRRHLPPQDYGNHRTLFA